MHKTESEKTDLNKKCKETALPIIQSKPWRQATDRDAAVTMEIKITSEKLSRNCPFTLNLTNGNYICVHVWIIKIYIYIIINLIILHKVNYNRQHSLF